MRTSETFVITINREFGTGGHEIGTKLAARLHVPMVDRQILKAVAAKFNMTEKEVERLEDRRPSWWDDFTQFYQSFMSMNEYTVNPRDITSRQLYASQELAMKKIAAEGSCVVIGRCGFNVFKHHPNALRVFLHSPLDYRLKRVEDQYHVDEAKARELISDNDYTRQVFTKTFTGKDWYDARNYDITLNVADHGVDGTVDVLMKLIEKA